MGVWTTAMPGKHVRTELFSRMLTARLLQRIDLEVAERETGIEPATSSLGSLHSTTELLPHVEPYQNDEGPEPISGQNQCRGGLTVI